MPDFLVSVVDFINNTQIPAQLRAVDAKGLFTNGYFMVPFIALLQECDPAEVRIGMRVEAGCSG